MELPGRVLIGTDIIQEFGNFLTDLSITNNILFVSGPKVHTVLKDKLETSLNSSNLTFDLSSHCLDVNHVTWCP